MLKLCLSDSSQEPCTTVSDPPQTTDHASAPEPSLVLNGFLRREELAKQLDCSVRKLDRLHVLREGPPRVTVGRTILYNIESVREWLRSREQQPPPITRRRSFSRQK